MPTTCVFAGMFVRSTTAMAFLLVGVSRRAKRYLPAPSFELDE